ncbi:unnamed protein product [Pedinophyceae sp. YPF-701]|nr:unnamed protein product [Pedinophyceae sp. YPF-701]
MGERKVLNKYYPPDFDPSKLPKMKKFNKPGEQMVVRMMQPFSLQCLGCGSFIYKGTKFNCRKEDVIGEDYLGIQIIRFYFRCLTCGNEITYKTDPKNGDYVCEHGGKRNYEPWRENEMKKRLMEERRTAEEKGDSMRALENRTKDSKREMDLMEAIDEMRTLNNRRNKIDPIEAINILRRQDAAREGADGAAPAMPEEDEDTIRRMLEEQKKALMTRVDSGSDSEEAMPPPKPRAPTAAARAGDPLKPEGGVKKPASSKPRIVVRKKQDGADKAGDEDSGGAPAALGLLGSYGSESD